MLFLPAGSLRVALGILGILGAIFALPWMTLLIMIALSIRYSAWEVAILGLLVDFLWFPGWSAGMFPLFTIAGLALMWGFEPLRREFLIEKAV